MNTRSSLNCQQVGVDPRYSIRDGGQSLPEFPHWTLRKLFFHNETDFPLANFHKKKLKLIQQKNNIETNLK